jgi:hypothetical protein
MYMSNDGPHTDKIPPPGSVYDTGWLDHRSKGAFWHSDRPVLWTGKICMAGLEPGNWIYLTRRRRVYMHFICTYDIITGATCEHLSIVYNEDNI